MVKHYINLTNGLKIIKNFNLKSYDFIRIQSTACEQKRWEFILNDLDHGFLMDLAIGNVCIVYNYSEKHQTTRALWQGIEWIKYVLYRRWFNKITIPKVKKMNVSKYFEEQYKLLDRKTKKRIDYYKKYLKTNQINIQTVPGKLKYDK